jgi:predicted transcriptional regulator
VSNVDAEESYIFDNTSTLIIASPYTINTDDDLVLISPFYQPNLTINTNEPIEELTIPDNYITIKLPDDKIGIKTSENTFYLLPDSSKIVYDTQTNHPLINLGTLNKTLYPTDPVVDLSFENFEKTIDFTYSVDKLDTYKTKINLKELQTPEIYETIEFYTIDWGDGNVIQYDITDISPTHIYDKYGDYNVVFNFALNDTLTINTSALNIVPFEGNLKHTYLVVEDFVVENKEPIAASTAGISTAAILGFAITETGKYKILTLLSLAIPLYTRVQKQDILDQFVRGQIYAVIKTNPGVHYNKIMDKIDVKNGTLSYHLHMLEQTGMIKSRREGLRYRAFYTTNMTFPKEERYRLTDLQIRILETIKSNEGLNQREIADILDEKPQTISYNIKVLQQADLVSLVKKGRKTRCYLGENYQDYKNESP